MADSEFVWQRSTAVVIVSGVASVLAFILYGVDKAASRRNARRIPEQTLHLCGLLGGWPGALVAQRVFHHKTRKLSFQMVFWGTVVLNCSLLAWALSSAGGRLDRRSLEAEEPHSEAGGETSHLPKVTPRPRPAR